MKALDRRPFPRVYNGTVVLAPTDQDELAGIGDISLCGTGATSRVYRGTEERSGRVVALKRMHRQLVRSGNALARLRRELEALRQIRHPGIVAVYDVIDWQGDPTIVMEYVPGEDLKERVMREGRLSVAETERIGRAILDILAVTHASGIVHRDVKPQNVRLAEDGRVCLLDFGSARLDAASQLTQTGTTVGTPEYMAPELFAASVYDPRVDIYGLGATLYECLTGRPPQTADSLAELAFLRTTTDVAPVRSLAPDVPAGLARVVDRCLGRDPEDRYASAGLALWALDHPEAEAAFAGRRSSLPPCLHCGTPIPATSTDCVRCHSPHPFSYSGGRWHVQIRSLRDPARFIEQVAEKFPERATPGHLQALAERCAALSFAAQTYLADIFGPEAVRVKTELESVGAEVRLVKGRSLWGPILVALVIAFLFSSWSGVGVPAFLSFFILTFGIGFTLWSAPMLTRARSSVLSASRWPRSLVPALSSMILWGLLFGTIFLSVLFAIGWPPLDYTSPRELLGHCWLLSAILLMALTTIAFRFTHPRLNRQQDARPAFLTQFWFLPQDGDSLDTINAGPPKAKAAANPLVVLVAILGLVATEAWLFSASWEWLIDRFLWTPPNPVQQIYRDIRPRTSSPDRPASPQPVAQEEAQPVRHARTNRNWTYAYPFVPLPLLIAFLYWRRYRVRKDSAAIFSDLDLPLFERLAGRDIPIRRHLSGRQESSPIATFSTGDAFFADALRRAAELAPCLPAPALERLSQTLEAVCKRRPAHQQAERSLTARCILETDPEQKARFDFLALEGQMEALAAQTWAARVHKPS
jgi:tRNA A-37 threonylcarbamoyl transferase component Bud32